MSGKAWSSWIWTLGAGIVLFGITTVSCCGVIGWSLLNRTPPSVPAKTADDPLKSHPFWVAGLPETTAGQVLDRLNDMKADQYAIVYDDGMVDVRTVEFRVDFYSFKEHGLLRQKTGQKHFIYNTVEQRTKPSKEAVQMKMKSLMDQAAYRGYAD